MRFKYTIIPSLRQGPTPKCIILCQLNVILKTQYSVAGCSLFETSAPQMCTYAILVFKAPAFERRKLGSILENLAVPV